MKTFYLTFLFFLLSFQYFFGQSPSDFVLTYKTDNPGQSNNTSISFDINGGANNGPIYYDIDWDNDGIFDETHNTPGRVTHDFGVAGTYTIRLRGGIPHFYQNLFWLGTAGCDAEKLIAIEQWGDVNITDFSDAFHTCVNLTINAVDNPVLLLVNSTKNMFNGCSIMNHDISNWNMSNVTDITNMLADCSNFNQPLNSWNVSSVTKMVGVFAGCTQFNQNLNSWTTDNVTMMSSMFSGATNFNGDITSWNTGNVTDTSGMFKDAIHFNRDISGWDTHNLQVPQEMFSGATAFNQKIDSWNTSKFFWVTYMFQNATSFNQDLNSWDMHLVQNMYHMFYGATSFNGNISNWNTGSCQSFQEMFMGATVFNQDIGSWNTSACTSFTQMFRDAISFNQNLNWDVTNATSLYGIFWGASAFNGDLSGWDVSNITNMSRVFYNAHSFNQDIGGWNVSNVTGFSSMFAGATSFNQDIGSWTTTSAGSNGTSSMFYNATNFNQDISNWDMSGVQYPWYMFSGATSFDQNLGSWDVSNFSNAQNMFTGVTLSTANYDALLIGWNAQTLKPNVRFSGGNSMYCAGASARANMIASDNWIITDGGLDPNPCGSNCSGSSTTWNGTAWSNGIPNSNTPVIINGNYNTASNGSFTACDCTINNGFTLTINPNDYINTYDTTNNGSLIVEDTGSFVQNEINATISGTGNYKYYRKNTPYVEYDYTYWSSPTDNETIGNVFNTHSTLIAGANHPNAINDDNFSNPNFIYWFNTANFNDDSPIDTFDDENDDWQPVTSSTVMTPGKGFIAMGAGSDFPFDSNFATGLQQQVYFEGKFNSGTINYPVVADNSSSDSYQNQNLIGNPYPSAIDAVAFMNKNLTVLEGTMYFWTHDSPISGANPGPNAFDFSNNDYAIATSDGTVFNYISNGTTGTTATQNIAAAQGFIVNVTNPGNIIFDNSMRISTPNNEFRRSEPTNLDRFWLNLTNQNGAFRQIMIGFYENGTQGFDNGLDGQRDENGNNIDFFTTIPNKNKRYAIQTLNSFSVNKEISLGVEIVSSDLYSISIDHKEGIFNQGQHILLLDNQEQIVHNLSLSNYDFYINQTEGLETRFKIVFENEWLNTNSEELNSLIIYPNPSKGIFKIHSNNHLNANCVIRDFLGKIINKHFITDIDNHEINLKNYANGIYFIEIYNKNNRIVKKIIKN